MKFETWTNVMMGCGFGAALICLGLLWFANLAGSSAVLANIGDSLGIGIGSIGLGSRIALARRK